MAALTIAALDGVSMLDLAATRSNGDIAGPLFAVTPAPTDGNDTLNGDGADDSVDALGGDDSVNGGGGNDTLLGGAGNDTLIGGDGNDSLNGGPAAGLDSLLGGNGDDVITVLGGTTSADTGADTVDLGLGTDRLVVDYAMVTQGIGMTLNFGAGTMSVGGVTTLTFTNGELFTLTGGSGNDTLAGGTGSDILNGGGGDDQLTTGEGLGADTVDGGDGLDFVSLRINASSANQLLDFTQTTTTFNGTGTLTNIERVFVVTGDGDDVIILRNQVDASGVGVSDTAITGAGSDTVTVTSGTTFNGSGFDNILLGSGASDKLVVNYAAMTENVFISSSAGTDGFTGTVAKDGFFGGNKVNFTGVEVFDVTSGSGNDGLSGATGADTLNGGGGNDTLTGGDGSDIRDGGTGTDRAVFNFTRAGATVTRVDATTFTFSSGGQTDTVRNVESFQFTDGTFSLGQLSTPTEGNDTLEGGAGNDTIDGLGGDDTITGLGGNDTLAGGAGADTLNGGAGGDSLSGGDGADSIIGGTGADTLAGGAGNDTIDGGADPDTAVFAFNRVGSTITRVNATTLTISNGGETDTVSNVESFQFGDGTFNAAQLNPPTEGNDTLEGGVGPDLIDALGGDDNVSGSNGDDTLIGGTGNDTLNGGDGQDSLIGGDGDDYLFGTDGADTLIGGSGNDLLFGQQGNDSIEGGEGRDQINLFLSSGSDEGADQTNLGVETAATASGETFDQVAVLSMGAPTQVRLTFTSAEVGNGSATDGGSVAPQDGGLAVRLQAEDGSTDTLTGAVSRFDDEGITFTAQGGLFFDVRDISGTARGDQFSVVQLGTQGADTITVIEFEFEALANTGGGANYYINGGGGADTITAASGHDFLVGGGGNDSLIGAAGDDTELGGAGNDTLNGGDGNDTLDGGADTDTAVFAYNRADSTVTRVNATTFTITNGSQTDTVSNVETFQFADGTFTAVGLIMATPGNDTLEGGAGNDTIDALAGDDRVNGNAGDDTLLGGEGNDTLDGGDGADVLDGGLGDDQVIGGGGDDLLYLRAGSTNDTVDGGAGDDLLDADFSAATTAIVFAAGVSTTLLGNTLLSIESVGGLRTGSGDDLITTSVNRLLSDSVETGAGNDTVIVLGGATAQTTGPDQVDLGDGTDTLVLDFSTASERIATFFQVGQLRMGASGDVVVGFSNAEQFDVRGGSGDDSIAGAGGADTLSGGAGADTLNGGAGTDTLIGGLGADLLLGGAGADTFVIAPGDSTVAASDALSDFTSGSDRISLTGLTAASRITIQQGTASSVLLVDNGGDGTVDTQVFVAAALTAADIHTNTPLGVTRIAGDGDQTLFGTAQADTVAAGAGNDLIAGGAGADSLFGQDGHDLIYGQDGDDSGFGGVGDDTIVGGSGADTLVGEDGADQLYGEAGADLLVAGAGADAVYGGADADTLVGDAGDDTLLGEDGADLAFGGAGADQIFGGAGSDQLFGGAEADLMVGGADNDLLAGEVGDDQLFGGVGADQLVGGDGVDSLFGGEDGDLLFGGAGGDTLNGEAGGDVIVGGAGGDVLVGGAGGDLFLYQLATDSTNAAGDLIVDFTAGSDVIDLSQVDANANLGGDQAFVFVSAFTGVAGQALLTYDAASNRSFFSGDVNGDGMADLVIAINGQIGQTGNFLL